jgi:hypothetical protein
MLDSNSEYNNKMNLNGIKGEFISCICEHGHKSSGIKGANFFEKLNNYIFFSMRASFCGGSFVIFFSSSYMSVYGLCVLSLRDLIRNNTS